MFKRRLAGITADHDPFLPRCVVETFYVYSSESFEFLGSQLVRSVGLADVGEYAIHSIGDPLTRRSYQPLQRLARCL
jgi:hypothetical protein